LRRRARLFGVLAALAVFGALFGAVVFSTFIVQGQQRLDRLNDQVGDAQAEYERLRLQVAQLESPSRIVDEATRRLGMVEPPRTTYLLPPPAADDGPEGTAAAAGPGAAAGDQAAASDGEPQADDWRAVKPFLGTAP
jgi:cell division protein FtsL